MSRRRSPRSRSLAAFVFPIAGAIAACQHPTLAASVDALWTGTGGNSSYANSANWNPVGVPVNDASNTYNVSIPNNISVIFDVDSPQAVTDLTIGSGTTFTIAPGKSLTVLDDAKIGGFLIVDTASFTASAPAAQFTGNTARLQASGGASLSLAATSYSAAGLNATNYTLFSATGAATSINLSSLQTLNDAWDDGWGGTRVHTISASNNALINLSKVQNLITPVRAEDRLDILTATGASIDFAGLQSITGAGQVRFVTDATTFSLPSLATCSILNINIGVNSTVNLPALTTASNLTITAGNSSIVNLPLLAALTNSDISLANNQTINAPNLQSFTASSLTLGPNQTLNAPAFTTINNSSFILTGGKTLAVNTPTYSATGLTSDSATLISLAGSGTSLDFSSVKTLNDGFNDSWGGTRVHTISVTSNASLNLSSTQNIISPARAEDRLDFLVNSGGSLDLTSLQTITGAGQVRFVTDATSFTLPALAQASGLAFVTGPDSTIQLPVLANATGLNLTLGVNSVANLPALTSADGSKFAVPDNGSINANALKSLTNSSIAIGNAGTFNAPALTSFTGGSLTLGAGQTLNAPGFTNIDNSVFAISGGATFSSPVTAYNATGLAATTTLFNVSGAGSSLDLSAVQTLNDAFNDNWGGANVHTITASASGAINLSNVNSLTAPARAEDRLDIVTASGGTINLAKLQSITGVGTVRFVTDAASLTLPMLAQATGISFAMNASSTLSLPALTNADRSAFSVPASGTFNLPELTTLTNSSIDLDAAATFNAAKLRSFSNGTLSLTSGSTLNTPVFTNIDNSRITLAGGALLTAAVPSYSATALNSTTTLFNVSGAGSTLDLSSVLNLTDAYDDAWGGNSVHTISVTTGATINLANLQVLTAPARAEDRLDLVTNTGGNINLNKLQSIVGNGQVRFVSDAASLTLPAFASANGLTFAMNPSSTVNLPLLASADRATFAAPNAGALNLPQLAILTNSSITIGNGGTFNAPNLKTFTNSTLALGANQTLNVPAFTAFNNTRFTLTGGATYAVAAPTYSATSLNASATPISLSGNGTSLDLSSLKTFNDGWDDAWGGVSVHTVSVSNNASLDLSNTQTIISPARAEDRLDFTADSNAFIDLSSLSSVTGAAQTRFAVGSGASIRVGDLKAAQNVAVSLSDATSSFRSIGSLFLGNNSLSAASGSKITVGRHFTHSATDEAKINTTSAIIQMVGPGNQYLEVAGKDSGLPSDALPAHSFAIGQLVVGSDDQPSVVELLDVVDNGNRAGSAGNAEALYLPGLGGPDGLVLKPGSTLVLGSINVYYRQGATWKRLNDMLGAGPTSIGNAYIAPSAELIPNAWNLDANGDWSPDPNWLIAAPNKTGIAAYFGNKASAPRTITVDSPTLLGAINFDNANAYTIAGSAPITLQVAGDTRASITANNRNGSAPHTLAAPLILNSPLLITQNSTAPLSLTGQLDNSAAQRITKIGPGPLTISGPQTHAPGAELFVDEGALTLNSDAGSSAALNLNVLLRNGSQTTLGASQHLASLKLAASSAAFTLGGAKVLVTPQLALDAASRLDLADNDLVVQADSNSRDEVLDQLTSLIAKARNDKKLGQWRGFGITSSAALNDDTQLTGLAVSLNDKGDGAGPLFPSFDGQPVNLNSALVKYTWNGDANLDGLVNADDYFLIDSGFLTQIGGYRNGDFNYDNIVNADDYFMIDSAFLGQKARLSLTSAPIPEPQSMLVLGACFGLWCRGRRRHVSRKAPIQCDEV